MPGNNDRSTDSASVCSPSRYAPIAVSKIGCTMTGRCATASLTDGPVLEISPDTATRLGMADGGRASVRSRYGEASCRWRISDRVQPGTLFTTFSDPAVRSTTSPDRAATPRPTHRSTRSRP